MQLLFVYVDIDNEEEGKPVADYFGITGDAPKVSFLSFLIKLLLFQYALPVRNSDTVSEHTIIHQVVELFLQVLGYTADDNTKKYILDKEVALENIKVETTLLVSLVTSVFFDDMLFCFSVIILFL